MPCLVTKHVQEVTINAFHICREEVGEVPPTLTVLMEQFATKGKFLSIFEEV